MSTMDGVSTPRDYINAALFGEQGHSMLSAIAITDHASVQAFPDAYREFERLQSLDVNLKLIYGNEIYMTDKGEIYQTSILVLNKKGLKNLYKLVSLANTEYFDQVPKTPKSELKKNHNGLLIGSGCDAGELYHAVRDGKSDNELMEITKFYDYLEVVPTGNFEYYIEQGYAKDREDLIAINKKIVAIGERAAKPVVAVSDAHYADEKDKICRKILMQYKGYENYEQQPLLSMRTTDEMMAEFAYLSEEKAYEIVVENTNKIADMVNVLIPPVDGDVNDKKNIYAADIKKLRDLIFEKLWQKYGLQHFNPKEFVDLILKKLWKKYGEDMPSECWRRFQQEFSMIGKNQINIFNLLLSAKLVERAGDKGWTVGNRDSVASSFIAYLLGITEINPLPAHYYCPKCHYVEFHNEYNCGVDMADKTCQCGTKLEKDGFTIPHETFFGPGCFSYDIGIDFYCAKEYQKEAFLHVKELTGSEIVRLGTVNFISRKMAFSMVNQYCKKEEIQLDQDQKEEIVGKLSHVKHFTDIYPGEVLLVPQGNEIYNYTPIQYPDGCFDYGYITHFDFYSIHYFVGLIKFCILGHDTLSMIRQLEEFTGIKSNDILLDDKKTMKLFLSGKTLGISEFGTDYVRECVMNQVKTYSFDNLIRIFGLSQGTGVWSKNGEQLILKGKKLSDIVSFRDDVMLYLISRGIERKEAHKISERIRRGRRLTEEQYDMLISKGVEKWRLDSWNKIQYSIPRARAASHVLLAYRLAYYKAHFPLEFYCAYFNIHVDDFNPEILINKAQELPGKAPKITNRKSSLYALMKVCQEMYDSGYKFTVDQIQKGKIEKFSIENGMLKPKMKK